MKYLIDTNVFMHTIKSIYEVANKCKEQNNGMCVTQTILNELEPGYYKWKEDESSAEIFTSVTSYINTFHLIELVNIEDIPGAKAELDKIRKKYYGWTNNHEYLKKLVAEGKLKREEIRNISKKDLGECELVAVAKSSKGEYWLVTNDLGRVFLHPLQNIYAEYKDDSAVNILSGEEWISKISGSVIE